MSLLEQSFIEHGFQAKMGDSNSGVGVMPGVDSIF